VRIPRAFSAAAIARDVVAPVACIWRTTGSTGSTFAAKASGAGKACERARGHENSGRTTHRGTRGSGRDITTASVSRPTVDLPARIGPAEFSTLSALVPVRCTHDLDALMQRAGGLWEPVTRRWLIERRRMGPLMRNLRHTTDPLFRQVGIDLDG
jgi:hypothetical protein